MRTYIATLTVATIIGLLGTSGAEATPTQVNVRIEGKGETLFEGPILTEGHDVQASSDAKQRSCDGINVNDPENLTPGPTPTAASADATSLIGETFDGQWYNTYDDYFITRWGPDEQSLTEAAYWGVLVNNVFTNVGGCQYELATGDEVLWVYDAFTTRPFLALFPAAAGYTSGTRPLTTTAELGKPFEVEVVSYADQREDKPSAGPERAGSAPFANAKIAPVQTSPEGFEKIDTSSPTTVTTDAEGKASITFTEPGWHRIKATFDVESEQAVPSNRLDVCVPAVGASDCGELPLEDRVRRPARYAQEDEKPASKVTPGNDEMPSGGPPQSGQDSPVPVRSGNPSLATSRSVTGLAPHMTFKGLTDKRLLLRTNVAGTATVRIASQQGGGRHRAWRTVKTITIRVDKAGLVEAKLPRLGRGRYRVRISFTGTNSVTKMLTVLHR